ncbi:MAG TPA: hypothetical protein VNT77_09975, partial [Allosphingosinicella sp.]|nr:hypothetical protein [Allosphingosinicella sp.]
AGKRGVAAAVHKIVSQAEMLGLCENVGTARSGGSARAGAVSEPLEVPQSCAGVRLYPWSSMTYV